jgi:hypothetical protein
MAIKSGVRCNRCPEPAEPGHTLCARCCPIHRHYAPLRYLVFASHEWLVQKHGECMPCVPCWLGSLAGIVERCQLQEKIQAAPPPPAAPPAALAKGKRRFLDMLDWAYHLHARHRASKPRGPFRGPFCNEQLPCSWWSAKHAPARVLLLLLPSFTLLGPIATLLWQPACSLPRTALAGVYICCQWAATSRVDSQATILGYRAIAGHLWTLPLLCRRQPVQPVPETEVSSTIMSAPAGPILLKSGSKKAHGGACV